MSDFSDRASRFQFGSTRWSMVFEAGKFQGDAAAIARNDLLVHYHDAVYRYLVAKLGDTDAAGELFSRFAERVLEIHPFLQRADPQKGRFRDYLKAILSRMVIDWYRQQAKGPKSLPDDVEPVQAAPSTSEDEEFRKLWAEELMNHAWKGLAEVERTKGRPFHSLLLYKAQNPKVRSEAMARHFTGVLGQPFTADNIRKLLQRGHELLNDLLVEEVARSLKGEPGQIVDADRIEEEMVELQLMDTPRRAALERYRNR
ncbi:MAG: sigma-70 family RNA polymerase sigma factor [Planctomycetes bacterium]|nr:sigma-70 family RNA polymerase sigma factor [Planctomycetota bacterium]